MAREITHKTHYKQNLPDKIFMAVVYLTLILTFLVTLYPLIFTVSASISDPSAVSSGEMILWPVRVNFDGYKHLLGYKDIWVGYANTIFYTVAGTALNLLVTLPAAYALSRKDLKGRNFLMAIFVVTMYFSGGMIPGYLNMKSFHLLNTRAVMLVSGLVSVYNMIVCRTFFASSIPWELHEAACLDGASDAKTFTKVILPLSKPIMAVMTLYYGVTHWNGYFDAMIYLRDRDKFPLQMILREILAESQGIVNVLSETTDTATFQALMQQQDVANQLKYAVIIVATLPMMVAYPFLEKHFAKGVMIGSVKG